MVFLREMQVFFEKLTTKKEVQRVTEPLYTHIMQFLTVLE